MGKEPTPRHGISPFNILWWLFHWCFFCCVVFVGVSNLTRLYFFLSVFLFFTKICVLDSLADIDELLCSSI